jgi:hypothetical protein
MLAIAIAAPKISFETFAMIAFSATLSTRRRLDYIAANSITLWFIAPQLTCAWHAGAADRGEYRQAAGASEFKYKGRRVLH